MDLFKSALDKKEEQVIKEMEKKRSIEIITEKSHKRYGTKKPEKRTNKHDILTSWREDL
jgi:hypothetical protein